MIELKVKCSFRKIEDNDVSFDVVSSSFNKAMVIWGILSMLSPQQMDELHLVRLLYKGDKCNIPEWFNEFNGVLVFGEHISS